MPLRNNQAPTFFRPSSIYIFGGFAIVCMAVYCVLLLNTMKYEDAYFRHQNLLKFRDENTDPTKSDAIDAAIKLSQAIFPAFKNMTEAQERLNFSTGFVSWFPYITAAVCVFGTWLVQRNFQAPAQPQDTQQTEAQAPHTNAPAM